MSSSLLCHESLRVREKSHLLLNARLKQLDADKLTTGEVHFLLCFIYFGVFNMKIMNPLNLVYLLCWGLNFGFIFCELNIAGPVQTLEAVK